MAPPCALFLSTHPSPAPAPAAHCGLYGTVATSKPHCGVRARVGEAPLRPGPGRPPWRSSAPTPKKKKKTCPGYCRGVLAGWGGGVRDTGKSPSEIPRWSNTSGQQPWEYVLAPRSRVEPLLPTPSSPGSSSTEILALGSESANTGCAAPGRVVRATEKGPGGGEGRGGEGRPGEGGRAAAAAC